VMCTHTCALGPECKAGTCTYIMRIHGCDELICVEKDLFDGI
jgi:hypothetical protein